MCEILVGLPDVVVLGVLDGRVTEIYLECLRVPVGCPERGAVARLKEQRIVPLQIRSARYRNRLGHATRSGRPPLRKGSFSTAPARLEFVIRTLHRRLVWVPAGMEDLIGEAPATIEIEITPEDPEASPRLADVELVFIGLNPSPVLNALPKMSHLRVVQAFSAGIDGIISEVPDGVTLCSARGSYTVVAEWVVGAILSNAKSFPEFRDDQRNGQWNKRTVRGLAGTTVLIIGYGAIGEAVESGLRSFGPNFVRVAKHARPGVLSIEDLPKVLPTADTVVLLVPLTPDTTRLVDANFLSCMKEGSLLVNAARGRVVDTEALLEALRADRLTAVLDVTDPEPLPKDHPLFAQTNVFITPHIAGRLLAPETLRGFLHDQLERFARDEPLENVVREGY
jgi:phosphoglycerate dehydrogenase-like enzyme